MIIILILDCLLLSHDNHIDTGLFTVITMISKNNASWYILIAQDLSFVENHYNNKIGEIIVKHVKWGGAYKTMKKSQTAIYKCYRTDLLFCRL